MENRDPDGGDIRRWGYAKEYTRILYTVLFLSENPYEGRLTAMQEVFNIKTKNRIQPAPETS